jgi:hypothetical protein
MALALYILSEDYGCDALSLLRTKQVIKVMSYEA